MLARGRDLRSNHNIELNAVNSSSIQAIHIQGGALIAVGVSQQVLRHGESFCRIDDAIICGSKNCLPSLTHSFIQKIFIEHLLWYSARF